MSKISTKQLHMHMIREISSIYTLVNKPHFTFTFDISHVCYICLFEWRTFFHYLHLIVFDILFKYSMKIMEMQNWKITYCVKFWINRIWFFRINFNSILETSYYFVVCILYFNKKETFQSYMNIKTQ